MRLESRRSPFLFWSGPASLTTELVQGRRLDYTVHRKSFAAPETGVAFCYASRQPDLLAINYFDRVADAGGGDDGGDER